MTLESTPLIRRCAWHDAARLLKQQNPNMSYAQIGRLLGVTGSAVQKALKPEAAREYGRRSNAKPGRREYKTQWDREHPGAHRDTCPCGNEKQRSADRCQGCITVIALVRRTLTEGMWADGWTCSEIGHVMGHASYSWVPVGRSRGWDLPHRRTPEQVKRIGDGWARAREARVNA